MTEFSKSGEYAKPRTKRERVRDFFWRLGFVEIDSQGERREPTSRIYSAEGGDRSGLDYLRMNMLQKPLPVETLRTMAERDAGSSEDLQRRYARIEKMHVRHEERRQEILMKDAEGSTLEPGEALELHIAQREA